MIKTDKIIYRTRTQVEYNWLMEKLQEAGFTWSDGSLSTAPEEADNWEGYLTETGIRLDYKMISYGDFNFYKNESDFKDYEIIEVSDIMEDEEDGEILDKLEDLKRIENEFKKLEKEDDESQKIKKIVYTTEVYFE